MKSVLNKGGPCPVCGLARRLPGQVGQVSHPACSRKLQEQHAPQPDAGQRTTTPRWTERSIASLLRKVGE